ncbi:MAG: AtpZ/AtpI family protein [Bacteroidales bacterium]|nr:AtpZ/AtpI family protein [Bacteroidales bacterium]
MKKKENYKHEKEKKQLSNSVKYSSIAFQMIAIILLSVFGGIKLDEYLSWDYPVFTAVFSILGVFIAMYYAIKDFLK